MLAFVIFSWLTSIMVSASVPTRGLPLKSGSTASEQGLGDNLILNGDFEAFDNGGFDNWEDEEEQPYLYYNCDDLFNYIEFWTHKGNRYNGLTHIGRFEDIQNTDDPDNVIADLKYYVAEKLFKYNSWMNSTCEQIINVESNTNYRFSYIWQAIVKSVRSRDDVRYPVMLWVKIYALDNTDGLMYMDPLYSQEISWNNNQDYFITPWSKSEEDITIPDNITRIKVEIGVNGQSGDDDQGAAGENDVQMNVSGMSLRKVLTEIPVQPDPVVPEPVEKDNYMDGATAGDLGRIPGSYSQLVRNGWQCWNCPYEYDVIDEVFKFDTPEDQTADWRDDIRLENNESYSNPNSFYYNDELFDGNIATFRWDGAGMQYNWYSYPVDLPEAGIYTFSMKAGIFNNYIPDHYRNDWAYVQDPAILVLMTSGIGRSHINGTLIYNDSYPGRIIPQQGTGEYFTLNVGEGLRSDMKDCVAEFTVSKPGRYYINLLGAYALCTFADFSLTKKSADSEVSDHIKLTIKHSGGIDVHAPVLKGKSVTISFNHDEYWQLESLKLNGDDVTADMDGLDYTTPELEENAVLESNLKYIGELNIGTSTDVFELPDTHLSISINNNSVKITGLAEGDEVVTYNTSGQILNSHRASESIETIALGSGIYIIRINKKAVKIIL